MTRRLEPTDRVRELSGASVPFSYDVHAMIYSENAPELESKLHNVFESKRINMVNARREFFRVTLEDIQRVVEEEEKEMAEETKEELIPEPVVEEAEPAPATEEQK